MPIVYMKKVVLLVGDFHVKIGKSCLDNFLFQYELQSLNKKPASLKTAHNLRCIDFTLTNSPGHIEILRNSVRKI